MVTGFMLTLQKVILLATLIIVVMIANAFCDPPSPDRLRITEWARNPMVMDPVALAFDNAGGLYVVESARRSTVDIDIRSHKTWLLDDLANDDFASMRDFFRRQMASSKSDENKQWLTDRNQDGIHDYQDLTTISERIRYLKDTDGDGKADHSVVYADEFQEEFTGVAAGVLPVNGDVLFTVYPDLWKLRDLDGDDAADGRVSLFRGFGVHAAFDGHDLHGLTIGPEGKIYFSCGDNGFSVTTKEGKRLHYPNTGGVLRMNPDGSDLGVFAYGLRNVQEFDFDQYGNMFGVDNDGDLEDERERTVYIAEGSDSGWRLNWQFRSEGWRRFNGGMTYNPWIAEGMWKPAHENQPAYITPPMQNYSVGPGGFKFNPGTGLNEDYRDFFFCVQFPVANITAFRTRPNGASFAMVDEHVFHSGLMASSVNFGPDGAFYIADWVGKWTPNNEGVIYRLDDPAVDGSNVRKQVQRLLKDGVSDRPEKKLAELLGHPDRRIRHLAQFELVRRKRFQKLLSVARADDANPLARIHAMWGLVQLNNASPFDESKRLAVTNTLPWHDDNSHVRQNCVRAAGDLKLAPAAAEVTAMLADDIPLVRSHAAIALGKLGIVKQSQAGVAARHAIENLLIQNSDEANDPFLRHAAVMGFIGCATEQQLAEYVNNSSSAIRVAAVLALRRMQSSLIGNFLHDNDLVVQRETVRAVHDDFSIPSQLPAVASMLVPDGLPNDEPIARRVISANLRCGTDECAQRLISFIVDDSESGRTTLKIEALNTLAVWGQSPIVDRVEGRIRPANFQNPSLGKQLIAQQIQQIFATGDPELIAATTLVGRNLGVPLKADVLTRWVESETQPLQNRVAALRALDSQGADNVTGLATSLLNSDNKHLRHEAIRILADRNADLLWQHIRVQWDVASVADKQVFVRAMPDLKNSDAAKLLSSLLVKLIDRELPPALSLDVLQAADGVEQLKSDSAKAVARAEDLPFGKYSWSLEGGDAQTGEQIYKNHVEAQCVRCHDAGGKGKQAGPVLSGIASRVDRAHLLEALVRPSAKIAEGFQSITIVHDDGRVLNGTVVREDKEHVVLATPQAKTITLNVDDIVERRKNEVSSMPDMTTVLSPMEVRDLVAYLSTLR
ncbi:MAG: c-type cytochrome [Planctomycetales bacterium]|nr:c-type cytochrome [Planctomycetales bacterium]